MSDTRPVRTKEDFLAQVGDQPIAIRNLRRGTPLHEAASEVDGERGDGVIDRTEMGRVFERYEDIVEDGDADDDLDAARFSQLIAQWRTAAAAGSAAPRIGAAAETAASAMSDSLSQGWLGEVWDWILENIIPGDHVTLSGDRAQYIRERAAQEWDEAYFPQDVWRNYLLDDSVTEQQRIDMLAQQLMAKKPKAYQGPDGLERAQADARAILAGFRDAAGIPQPGDTDGSGGTDGTDETDGTDGTDGTDRTAETSRERETGDTRRATRREAAIDLLVEQDQDVLEAQRALQAAEANADTDEATLAELKQKVEDAKRAAAVQVRGDVVRLSAARARVELAKQELDALNAVPEARRSASHATAVADAQRRLSEAEAEVAAIEARLSARLQGIDAGDNPRRLGLDDLRSDVIDGDPTAAARALTLDADRRTRLILEAPAVKAAIAQLQSEARITGPADEREATRQGIPGVVDQVLRRELDGETATLSREDLIRAIEIELKKRFPNMEIDQAARNRIGAVVDAFIARRTTVDDAATGIDGDAADADTEAALVAELQDVERRIADARQAGRPTEAHERRKFEIQRELIRIREARGLRRVNYVGLWYGVRQEAAEEEA